MYLRKYLGTVAIAAVALAATPRTASADWTLTPFVGWNFGSSADVSGSGGPGFKDKFEKKIDYGASLLGMGSGSLGFEIDFGYSPNFFETSTTSSGFQFASSSNVTTLMGSLVVGAHSGAVRPYAVAGVGLLRTKVQDFDETFDVNSKNDFGLNVGAGVMGFFSDNVGLRGDVRYFRGFRGTDDNATGLTVGDFKFWRGSLGLSLKF
jgi:opacity protein-like surface antigen